MAGKSLIGALRVFLGIDSAELTKGTKEAENSVKEFVENTKKNLERLVAAFAVKELVEGFIKIDEHLDMLGKSAQKIGIPVEELSKLEYAAKLADVPFEGLMTTVEKFNKGISEAAATGKGKVAEAFKAMGISVLDAGGHMKTTNTYLIEIANSFSKHADGANKGALGVALFGKTWAEILPLLNKGGAGIADAGKQLDQFGGAATDGAVAAAETLIDDLKRMWQAFYSVAQQVVITITPAITKLTSAIVDFLSNGGNAKMVADAISAALVKLAEVAVDLYGDFRKIGQTIFYISDRIANGFDDKRWQDFKSTIQGINAETKNGISLIEKFAKGAGDTNRDRLGGNSKSEDATKPQFSAFSAVATKATKEHRNAINELIASLKIQNEEFTKSALQMKIDSELQKVDIKDTDVRKQKIIDLTIALEKHRVEQQTAMQLMTNALEQQAKAADFLKGKFESWFSSAIDGTFNLKSALADLAKSIATMGFQKLLGGLFSGDGGTQGSAGGSLLSGLGKILGFATGGTIMPGGSGGVDSQLVAFRKSPDERVDITRPGQRLTSGGGTTVHFNIDGRGADAGQIAQLRSQMQKMGKDLERTILASVTREKASNWRFAT